MSLAVPLAAFQQKGGQKGQTQGTQKKDDKDKDEKKDEKSDASKDEKPKPLFEGKMQLKSSRRGADTASAGFNGVGDDGKVTKEALAKSATRADSVNAEALVAYSPTPEELTKFLEEGKLTKAQPKSQDNKKKK
jgi:hypothetical protein